MYSFIKNNQDQPITRKEEVLNSHIFYLALNLAKDSMVIMNFCIRNNCGPKFTFSSRVSGKILEKKFKLKTVWGDDFAQSKYKVDLNNNIDRSMINFIAKNFINKVFSVAIDEDVDVILIEGKKGKRLFPQTDCDSVDFNYDIYDLIQDYAPSKILLYPLDVEHKQFEHYMFGLYLLDDEDNFVCRQFLEFFHEDVAPKGWEKLITPKTSTEFNRLFGLDD